MLRRTVNIRRYLHRTAGRTLLVRIIVGNTAVIDQFNVINGDCVSTVTVSDAEWLVFPLIFD